VSQEERKRDPRVQRLIAGMVLGAVGLGVGYITGEVSIPAVWGEEEEAGQESKPVVRKIRKVKRKRATPKDETSVPDPIWKGMTPSKLRAILGPSARNVSSPYELLRFLTEEERGYWRYYVRRGITTSYDKAFVYDDARHLVNTGDASPDLVKAFTLYQMDVVGFNELYNAYKRELDRMDRR
jgi:hypothetical protein